MAVVTVGSPGCIARTLMRRDALPGPERVRRVCGFGVEGVRIEPPAPQAAAFRGLLVGYVLRPRDKSVGRPAKISHRSPGRRAASSHWVSKSSRNDTSFRKRAWGTGVEPPARQLLSRGC